MLSRREDITPNRLSAARNPNGRKKERKGKKQYLWKMKAE